MVDAQTIRNYLNQCALVDQPATLSTEMCIVLLAEFNAMQNTISGLQKQVDKQKEHD